MAVLVVVVLLVALWLFLVLPPYCCAGAGQGLGLVVGLAVGASPGRAWRAERLWLEKNMYCAHRTEWG